MTDLTTPCPDLDPLLGDRPADRELCLDAKHAIADLQRFALGLISDTVPPGRYDLLTDTLTTLIGKIHARKQRVTSIPGHVLDAAGQPDWRPAVTTGHPAQTLSYDLSDADRAANPLPDTICVSQLSCGDVLLSTRTLTQWRLPGDQSTLIATILTTVLNGFGVDRIPVPSGIVVITPRPDGSLSLGTAINTDLYRVPRDLTAPLWIALADAIATRQTRRPSAPRPAAITSGGRDGRTLTLPTAT